MRSREKEGFSLNLPSPLFSKEGKCLPLEKGGQEGFSIRCRFETVVKLVAVLVAEKNVRYFTPISSTHALSGLTVVVLFLL